MADPISRGYTGNSTIGNSAVFRRQPAAGAVCYSYHWDQVARFGKRSAIRERGMVYAYRKSPRPCSGVNRLVSLGK